MPTQYAEPVNAQGLGAAQPIPRRNGLREEVYEAILELLVQNAIGEGSALRVEALAKQLDHGVLVVRDGDGHTGYNQGNTCADEAVEDFLVSDKVPANGTRC